MKFFPAKPISIALLLLFCGAFIVQAQGQQQRWLLIFGTSSAMKKRLPAVEDEVKTLFGTDFGGKISPGDSIAVWTVGDKLNAGEYPLLDWAPESAAAQTTNLIAYLRGQSYSGSANLAALQPVLGQVVANSDRLTILIFCDGTEQMKGSPFDDGINDSLRQTAAERKKSQQPVLIVMRSREGKYTGAMVNFPPVPVNLPAFPQSPATNVVARAAAIASNPPPVVAAAPAALVIIGTHVSTNPADLTNTPPVVVEPAPVVVPKTNLPVVAMTPPVVKTNLPAPATNAIAAVVQSPVTNPVPPVAAANPDDRIEKILTIGGIGLLVVAAGLVGFLFRRKSAPQGSLITTSMQEKFRSPDQK
jgi:hypothetical protein